MPRKTLRVQVELDIQAVTCPGVWLCPNGKVSLQIFMLESCVQTTGVQPVFPLLFHEKFIFYKNFQSAFSLSELQKLIAKDYLCAELVQWQHCDMGNVIASFQTSLFDVLYPTTYEGAIAGVDVDLLMEPSKNFPGIIAPKIEISTRTTVEEIVCSNNPCRTNSYVINPKTVASDQLPHEPRRQQLHQQKVCHSVGYHNKLRKCSKVRRSHKNKPPFVIRKVESKLLDRKPGGLDEDSSAYKCQHYLSSESSTALVDKKQFAPQCINRSHATAVYQVSKSRGKGQIAQKSSKKKDPCSCGREHGHENCSVCSKYHLYFDEGSKCNCPNKCNCASPQQRGRSLAPERDSYVRKVNTSPLVKDLLRQRGRSPIKIFGKQCRCQEYSPSATCISDVYECTPCQYEDKCTKRMCYCPPRKKPSLAEQIHHRLKQTLDAPCVPQYQYEQNSGSDSLCNSCPKFANCKEGFYKNLGKFYRNLRRC